MGHSHGRLLRNGCLASAGMLCALLISGADQADPFAYFAKVRGVKVTDAARQNYVVLDESVLEHAQAGLGDLRFYSGSAEVPYTTAVERGSAETGASSMTILNKGRSGGDTRFTVDVSLPEYDNIRLTLSAKDFIAQARLEGANDAAASDWTNLGTFTLFDFTKERLGNNSTIRLSTPARFRFLRITISGAIRPEDVAGASVANMQVSKARYVALRETPVRKENGKNTLYEWDAPERIPLDLIHFDVARAEVNFNRTVSVDCDKYSTMTYELSRIHMVRKGRAIDSEDLDTELPGLQCKHYKVEIENGNDAPLRITAVTLKMMERRAYFDPRGSTSLSLYYGDEKLERPVYDYAKLFEEPANAAEASLQPETQNAAYKGRPDARPWSERHPSVLWIAMIVAVGLLGAWAVKGFKA